MNHFDEITCLLYLDGQLDATRRSEFEAHAGSCGACRALLAALEGESRMLREAVLEEEAAPAHLLEGRARETVSWAWLVGWGLAAAGVYTLWAGFVEPLRQQLNQAGFGEGNLITMIFFSGAFWHGWSTMKTLVEFAAMITLGVVLLMLFGRRWRRTTLAMIVAVPLALVFLPGRAEAAETHHGDPNYSLPAGQAVKNDVIVFAGSVEIDGDVDGDLIVFASHLEVSGHVSGDVLSFAGELRITGRVDGNVRDFSSSLFLGGSVGKNVMAWVGRLDFDSKSQVGGGVLIGAGETEFKGRIGRDLMTFVGEEALDGFVGGDAQMRGGKLRIGSAAVIQGHAVYRGDQQPFVSSQAKLASPLETTIVSHRPDYASWHFYLHQLIFWGAIFLYGLVLAALMPRFYMEVVASSEHYGASSGLGVVALLVTPILAVIACVTLVGMALGIATLFLYFMALFAAQTFVGTWIGQKLLGESIGLGAIIGRMALGLIIIRVIRNVPYIGGWLILLLTLWGMGALLLAVYRRMRLRAVPAPAV